MTSEFRKQSREHRHGSLITLADRVHGESQSGGSWAKRVPLTFYVTESLSSLRTVDIRQHFSTVLGKYYIILAFTLLSLRPRSGVGCLILLSDERVKILIKAESKYLIETKMSICTLYLVVIQEKAVLVRLEQSDLKIAIRKPHENGSLSLSVQKTINHCWLVVSSDYIKVNA